MLKLVVNNKKVSEANSDVITCRNACDLFDSITESCSIKQNVHVDSPFEAARCGHFISREYMSSNVKSNTDFRFKLIENDQDYILDDEEIFHEFVGKPVFDQSKSTYPLQPDYPAKRDDATWYISPCSTFGCWIINEYKRPLSFPSSIEQVEKGWHKNVYRSPIPLHDHKTSLALASRIAWVVDGEGYGQYCLLINGKTSTTSYPKPANWNPKY